MEALGDTLADRGHTALARAEPEADSSEQLSGLLVPVLFWCLGSSAGIAISAPIWAWFALSLVMLIGYFVVADQLPRFARLIAGFLILIWAGLPVVFVLTEPQALIWTYAVPIGGALLVAVGLRSLRLRQAKDVAQALAGVARSAPYLAPVVLIAIILPALTADVWRLGAQIQFSNLAGAALLSVGVLLLLVGRHLRHELEPAMSARCRALARRASAPEEARDALTSSMDSEAAQPISEIPTETMAGAWPVVGEEYAPYLAAAEGKALRRPLWPRVVVTVGIVAGILFGYVYALLAATVPSDVAAEWSASDPTATNVNLLGVGVSFPCSPYVEMAGLLGVLATAIFLAFALTEERIAAAVTEALLREPIDRFLLLALPYVALLDWGLAHADLETQRSEDAGDEEEPGGGSESK